MPEIYQRGKNVVIIPGPQEVASELFELLPGLVGVKRGTTPRPGIQFSDDEEELIRAAMKTCNALIKIILPDSRTGKILGPPFKWETMTVTFARQVLIE